MSTINLDDLCLAYKLPKTNDESLDKLISFARKEEIATKIFLSAISHPTYAINVNDPKKAAKDLSKTAFAYADTFIGELEKEMKP